MLPASAYLTATPRFQAVGWIPVACLLAAAVTQRRDDARFPGRLVAAAALYWSTVASMLAMPLLPHVVAAGTSLGLVTPRAGGWRAPVCVAAGIVGGQVGALASFGDTPLLMRHPWLNSSTLSVAGAALAVLAARAVARVVAGN